MKTVYTCFCTDVIHDGHLNIIKEAKKRGKVIVGCLSDEALIRYNKFPTISQEERIKLYKDIDGVEEVVIQNNMLYDDVIPIIQPDYVVHGDNWLNGPERAIRDNVEELLKVYGGELVDIPYTRNEKVKKIDVQLREKLAMPEYRRKRLRQLISIAPVVKVLEAHSGLTGLIVEKTVIEHDGKLDQFDAMWISSLCDSLSKGKPDIELVDMTSRFRTIDDIMEVTTKPIIFDGDTGGLTEHFVYTVRTLERMGVSAVIIEDKKGLKKNSLFGTEVEQTQATIEEFCEKIAAGKKAQLTDDFMIIARIESLILEKGMEDALKRSRAFVRAGADGIMIHSRKKDPAEILEFCDRFREEDKVTPIVVVPSSFNTITEEELIKHGVNIVIYANQLTRSAFPAMQQTAEDILKYHRAKEVDDRLMPINNIITLINEL
ncbi:MAG TPA: phosphoenolpyruvate mutase [Clostridia bacterium]|nr:phosphoenolpyruvate mutase [Clostridiaceae bacterium]HOM34038.1 phosphoenolpyruvate mutase [Clostridia bacterium]HOT71306.1 phosphoenolpyruvate mutase [Clostridia bacterium]HPL07746.1 phosphoenolpyruvate mutase [Clostridia bacterium]HQJ91860.1 phosphoenolpyruvate mutase [Clostridia bacterium]